LAESVAILLDSVFANSGRLLRVLIKFGAYKSNKEGSLSPLHLVDTTLYLVAQAQISFGHLEKELILQATKGMII
jgi:hypothetical protein